MKKNKYTLQIILAAIILLLVPVFVIKQYYGMQVRKSHSAARIAKELDNEYATSGNKCFVVLVFSSENEAYCEKNLESIFSQSYQNYRVIYLDIGENSDNLNLAKRFAAEKGMQNRVRFVKNNDQNELFHSFCDAVKNCKDEEIVVHLEGSDWFANDKILEKLNETYIDPDVWLTYGECVEYPSFKKKELNPTTNWTLRDFRASKTPWMLSHVKTYYAGLLKQMTVGSQNAPQLGGFGEDRFMMLSLLKVAKWHVRFIPEVLYVHQPSAESQGKLGAFLDKIMDSLKFSKSIAFEEESVSN